MKQWKDMTPEEQAMAAEWYDRQYRMLRVQTYAEAEAPKASYGYEFPGGAVGVTMMTAPSAAEPTKRYVN
jgi:hypothetical protein